jgi:hypothetical protein
LGSSDIVGKLMHQKTIGIGLLSLLYGLDSLLDLNGALRSKSIKTGQLLLKNMSHDERVSGNPRTNHDGGIHLSFGCSQGEYNENCQEDQIDEKLHPPGEFKLLQEKRVKIYHGFLERRVKNDPENEGQMKDVHNGEEGIDGG